MGALQSGHGADGGNLDILRQTGGEAVEVVLMALAPLGFKEELMALLVGEAMDFILDRGAVAGSDTLDHPLIEGGAVEPGAEDVVGAGAGAGEVAGKLVHFEVLMAEAERDDLGVPGLLLHALQIDGAAVEARGGAGLEPAAVEAVVGELFGDAAGGRFSAAPSRKVVEADMNEAVEKGAGTEDNRTGPHRMARFGHHPTDLVLFDKQGGHALLAQGEVLLLLEQPAHAQGVVIAVILGARGPDGGTLGAVEHAELQGGLVRHHAHGAAEGVDLLDEVALGQSADGGIAGHLRQGEDVLGDEQGGGPHPGGRQRGLAAGMTPTHYQNVIAIAGAFHRAPLPLPSLS
ncbi:MAG: hypothetical protein BWY77_01226 [bacterium ADurb.Bin431]|nr:MAG: hypothetical protein BWY77_01226 [bacterium ADurb.Bin431]